MTTAVHDDAVALGRRLGVALSDDEIARIADHLARLPTPTELFAFDAQWSEHCSYKSSREYLGKLPIEGPDVLLGVGEDAGIVRLGEYDGDTYGIVVAHESHNHPSQVVPFEGAATGIGGIVRDVLCMGAEVIGLADPLRFGRLEEPHSRYVAQAVVDGIAAYGNAIGVPNLGGDVFFDASFDDNVLVNVVAIGLVKERDIIHSAAPAGSEGWDIVLVGKATDRSGFGGASFSSGTLDEEDAEQNKGAVQVPDPFLKNVIMRATYAVFAALRENGVTAGFKDLGAGGLTGCSAELCAAGGMGAEIELERVPIAQADLPPEVIAIGETQERLCWIVPPSFTPTLLAIYNDTYSLPRVARGACAAPIGKVTTSGRYVARLNGSVVMDVDLAFLTGGVRYHRAYELPVLAPAQSEDARAHAIARAVDAHPASLGERLARVLAHRDVCSRRTIYQRYDGVVRGCSALPPGTADAGVLVPIPGSPLGVAVAIGGNPRYGAIDPRHAARLAVAEAIGRVTAVGARAVGLTDCLNFGDPTVPEHMGAFVAAVDGLAETARALHVPFVSGNVSLYNRSSSGNHVAPSPIVGAIGVLDDIACVTTRGFKHAGSAIVITAPLQTALGGSVIAEQLGLAQRDVPAFAPDHFARACTLVREGLRAGTIAAAHLVGDGGVLTAIAKMAFASRELSFRIDPAPLAQPHGHELVWFSEVPAFVVEVVDAEAFARATATIGIAAFDAGVVIDGPDAELGTERVPLAALREAWEAPLRDFYGSVA